MTQAYEEVIEMKRSEVEEIEVKEAMEEKADELLGDLNPRYFEEAYSLEEAKNRAEASRITPNINNSFFGGF